MEDPKSKFPVQVFVLEPACAAAVGALQELENYEVLRFTKEAELIPWVTQNRPGLLFLSINGKEELARYGSILKAVKPAIDKQCLRVIVLSKIDSPELAAAFSKLGCADFLPFHTPVQTLAFKSKLYLRALAARTADAPELKYDPRASREAPAASETTGSRTIKESPAKALPKEPFVFQAARNATAPLPAPAVEGTGPEQPKEDWQWREDALKVAEYTGKLTGEKSTAGIDAEFPSDAVGGFSGSFTEAAIVAPTPELAVESASLSPLPDLATEPPRPGKGPSITQTSPVATTAPHFPSADPFSVGLTAAPPIPFEPSQFSSRTKAPVVSPAKPTPSAATPSALAGPSHAATGTTPSPSRQASSAAADRAAHELLSPAPLPVRRTTPSTTEPARETAFSESSFTAASGSAGRPSTPGGALSQPPAPVETSMFAFFSAPKRAVRTDQDFRQVFVTGMRHIGKMTGSSDAALLWLEPRVGTYRLLYREHSAEDSAGAPGNERDEEGEEEREDDWLDFVGNQGKLAHAQCAKSHLYIAEIAPASTARAAHSGSPAQTVAADQTPSRDPRGLLVFRRPARHRPYNIDEVALIHALCQEILRASQSVTDFSPLLAA